MPKRAARTRVPSETVDAIGKKRLPNPSRREHRAVLSAVAADGGKLTKTTAGSQPRLAFCSMSLSTRRKRTLTEA
jgi:hypothetical protein